MTQVQALRAAHNAGFLVPKGTIRGSGPLYRALQHAGGGHLLFARHLAAGRGWRFRPPPWPRSTTPANTTPRSPSAVWITCGRNSSCTTAGAKGAGTTSTPICTPRKAFTWRATSIGTTIFPAMRDQLLKMQNKEDGSWEGDGIGQTYGTAIALIVLQLPYKYLARLSTLSEREPHRDGSSTSQRRPTDVDLSTWPG